MNTTLTGFALAAHLAAKYDAGFQSDGGDGDGFVSVESLRPSEARSLEAELIAAGFEASWTPDADDKSQAWVYVTIR